MKAADRRWNLNVHHHRAILRSVPPGARRALDVGCGDGLLSFDLADAGLTVTGLDRDPASVARAAHDARAGAAAAFIVGDLLAAPFPAGTFDVVASVAMLHHVDAEAGLRGLRGLVRPGGVLAIVGFARPSTPADRVRAAVGAAGKRIMQWRGRYWEHTAPVAWPPPCTMREMAGLIRRELPGATLRGGLSSRYVALWTRPPG